MAKTGRGGRRNQKLRNAPQRSTPTPPAPAEAVELAEGTLPEDLIIEILCRTPVKSLVRFRCVCKSWNALIHHPKFIELHLNHNTANNKRTLFHGFTPNTTAKILALFEPSVILYRLEKNHIRHPDYPHEFNFSDFINEMDYVGSYNGIVCLTHCQNPEGGRFVEWGKWVVLWNPAINQFKLIPLPRKKTVFDIWQMVAVGLGYDPVANDFKIIRIVPVAFPPPPDRHILSRVEIYSANKDSWEVVKKGAMIPFTPVIPNCGFIIRGVPYFVGSGTDRFDLWAFEPRTGKSKKFPLPESVRNERTSEHPVNMMDSVAVLVYSPGKESNHMVDCYILDESCGSWTKKFSTGPFVANHLRMPQCLSTGEIVVETWEGETPYPRHTYLYDPKTSSLSTEFDALNPLWYQSYSHVESLVSVKGMKLLGKEDSRKKKKMQTKKNRSEFLSEGFEVVLRIYKV